MDFQCQVLDVDSCLFSISVYTSAACTINQRLVGGISFHHAHSTRPAAGYPARVVCLPCLCHFSCISCCGRRKVLLIEFVESFIKQRDDSRIQLWYISVFSSNLLYFFCFFLCFHFTLFSTTISLDVVFQI